MGDSEHSIVNSVGIPHDLRRLGPKYVLVNGLQAEGQFLPGLISSSMPGEQYSPRVAKLLIVAAHKDFSQF